MSLSPPAEAPAPQALRTAVAPAAVVAAPVVAPAAPTGVAAAAASIGAAVTRPAPAVVPAPVVAAPVQAVPAASGLAVARPASPVRPVSAVPGRGALVQLAAVGSEGAAQAEWARLSKRMPDLLGGKAASISKVERDGRTMWRVRTGGFADAAAARGFCEQVKAKSAPCVVATP